MPKPRRKSFGAACEAISSTAEFEEGQAEDDFDSDSESSSSEPPMDDPKSPSSDEEEDIIDPGMSVHITDDAITPECMAKLQPTVLLQDCLSPNVSRQNAASPVPLNNDWKPSPLAGTQKQSDLDNKQQPKIQQRSDHRALKKARERSGSPVHNLLSRILTKKTGIETVLSPLSKDKPSGDKSPEAAPSPDSLNPDSPGESSAREGLEENKTSTVTPLKENLALTRTRLTSSPAVYESPTKSQFTRVHGSPYPPGSPQMSPVVVLHDCCTPPRGTRQTRAQRMASWYVEEDDDDDDEMAELLEKEEEEEYVFPEPLSTSAESFFGRKIEATVEIHGETLAESSLYHSLSCSSKRRQALLAPVPTRRARYSLRHAKQHFKNGCIINGNDEITFISSTKTTAKELLKETRRRQRSLHFTPSPVHRRNKRFKGEGKTGDPPSRMSTRLQRQRAPLTSSPEESQDDCLTAEELPPTSEDPMEDPAGLHDQSNVVFYDEVILCPEEDDFQEDSSTAELPHSSWSLSPPTTRPQSTGSESPPIREEPCSPPPITELLTSRSPPITVCQPTRSESPPIREEPCSPPPIIELLTSQSPPITVRQSPRSESPPIREEPCSTVSESPPIRGEPSSTVSVFQPITDHNSTTGSNFQPIMEQESRAGSENPPITEEETTTQPQPTVDQPSNFESQSPPIKSQTSLSKSSPSPNTVEQPTTALPSPLNNSLQTIKDPSPSSSDKSEDDSSRIQSPILEEEEDDTYEEPETEPLRYMTVSRRGHEDTPLPGRRLSSRVAQALAEDASITATQVGKSHQTVEQSQDQATSGGGRKSSRDALKQKRKPSTRQQKGIEVVAEETGQEKEEENTKNDQNVVEVQDCGLDENETSDKECHAPDIAMATSDVAMETSSIPEEEPIGDFPEIVFKDTAENNVDTPEVSQREANFSDTTKGGEDIIVEHEEDLEEEAGPKRPRRFRKPAAKPTPSSAVKLRKGRGRKQEEDIEVIYRNKNYKAPEQKTFETIYEDPIIRKKTGEEQLVGRPMKRKVSFRNFYYPKKMNKKKASKNVKRFRRKSLEGVTVDEKLINLDRQMIGISPAKFCLPGDQMLFQFASEEASSDLVTVKEEPLDLIDEENHQALDLSGVGPLDEEEEEGIAQEFEIENKEVRSQGELLQEETEEQAEKDITNSVTRKPGRKRRRSSLTAEAKIKVLENVSQTNSESDDHMPRNSKPKKSKRKSSTVKQDSCVSLSADMSKETSGSSSEVTEEVEASRLPEHVSLSSSESATTSELEGEVTQGKKRGRRKSIQSNKPVDTASSDRQASDLDSVDLVIDAVIGGKYFEEPSNQTTQQATSEASQASIQDVSTTQQTSKEAKKRRRSRVLSVPVEPQDDLQNADGKGRGQKAKTKGQANGKGSNPEGKIEVETTERSADALGLTEGILGNMKGKTARQRSRRRSLLLSQQSSSVEDGDERNTEASNSEEEKLASSQEPAKKKTSTRRKSVLPPTVEDASSTTEGQNSTEDESSSSVSVKKKGRRRSTVSTVKQDAAEDLSQQSRLTEEQTLEEGYSTESSVTSVVVRRRSRRKSVLLQQSSSEDYSQPAKKQGTESLDSEETATTSVAKKRSRRRSVVIHRSGSLSEEGMEAGQWSGSELSCDVPLPEIRSVKTRKTRRQDIIPGSSTCEDVERAMSESEESQVSTASGPVTTRRSRRRSVLLKTSSANEEDSRPPDNVSPVRKTAKQHMESLGEASVTSTVLKEEPSSVLAEHQTDVKTGQIEEPQVVRKEHQSENDLNLWGCSSQESASSQSVGGFGEFVEDEASGVSRRKRKRRKSVLLKQFSWAGESPPGSAPISEKFGTKAEERKQTEETLPSCSQQTSEEGIENVPDCLESDDVVSFNLEVSRKEKELKEVHSDAEATDSEAILPAKKAKKSLCGNDEEKNRTSDSSESLVDSQPQVSTVRKRRKSIFKKATNEEKIVTSSSDILQDILNNDDYDELQSPEVQSDLQTVTQPTRRQKRKRAAGPVVSNQSSEEMYTSGKEDKTETSKSQDLPTDIGNEESLSSTGKVEETMSEDQVSEKQPKRKGRRKSQSFRPQKVNKFLTENQAAESTTPNQTEEDFVTKEKTYTDEKHAEITDEPKRKVRRQSARFRRVTPKKMASPKITPPPDNNVMFEEDFVTNDDTFIDNEEIESLINSIAEGNTPVGSPYHSVSTKIADVNVEKDIKKPGQKRAKPRKKNAGKRAGTRGRKKAEPPKTPKESSPQNRKPAKTPKDSSPQISKPTSTVSPKLGVAENNKTAIPVESEENSLQDNACSIGKEKKAKKGGKSLSPATNEPKIHENGDKTTAMLSPTSQNNLKKTPENKTPSSALQSHTDNGKSSQKSSPTTPSQSQKRKVIMKEPPHSPETVFSPKSRDQARQISSLFSVLSRSTSSPDANQSLLGAMPSFKSLVKDVVSPETTVNSSQPVQDTSCDTRKSSKQTSFASKGNSGSKSANNTPYSSTSSSSKPGLLAEQTPQAESCDTDVASSFSCHGNTSWKDTTVSNSGKSKSFTFAKAYSAKQHWAKRFMNTKDTYLNKFKMFAFGSPSSQSSAED